MNDLELWHVKKPVTPERMARILVILLEVPRRKVDPFEVLACLNGDKLGQLLALAMDVPVAWIRRNFSACGALQCLAEFLRMEDLEEQTRKMRTDKKARAFLEANYG